MHPRLVRPVRLGAAAALALLPASAARDAAARDMFERAPIHYSATEPSDRIAALRRSLESGELRLDATLPEREFVEALLEALEVPAASQVLVFSKSSLQNSHIAPRRPRALYFSEDVYLGWARGSDDFEIISADPALGLVFYLIRRDRSGGGVEVHRETGACFSCHAGGRTGGMPGLVIRSLHTEESGQPIFSAGGVTVDHATPFEDRWGGWYVTGSHGEARHLGNLFARTLPDGQAEFDPEEGANLEKLDAFFDTSAYPVPTSDLVALMVLEHQAMMHNRFVEGGFQVRAALYRNRQLNRELGRENPDRLSDTCRRIIAQQADRILEVMLFREEAPLPDGGIGSEGPFLDAFAEGSLRNREGRSLRDFRLLDRIFKYRCSYMIHSQAFRDLPGELHREVLERLDGILSGRDPDGLGEHLSASERTRIREILEDTLPEFPPSRGDGGDADAAPTG